MALGPVPLPGEILVFADIKIRVSYLISNSSLIAIYGAWPQMPHLEKIHEKVCYLFYRW